MRQPSVPSPSGDITKRELEHLILKTLLTVDNDFEMVTMFIEFEPQIAESKYITKYLNQNKRIFQNDN